MLSCWKVLEGQVLETSESVRDFVLSWTGEYHPLFEARGEQDAFVRGQALMFLGRGLEASVEFKSLIPSRGPKMRGVFERLSLVASQFRLDFTESEWEDWQTEVNKIHPPKEDALLFRLVQMLQGNIGVIVKYFQELQTTHQSKLAVWPNLLAAILLFKVPFAKRSVLCNLVDCCVEPFPSTVKHQFEASRFALKGELLRPLQKLHDYDSWAECHMALLFCAPESELQVSLVSKFARHVGLGARVETSRRQPDLPLLALGLEYLNLMNQREDCDLLIDRFPPLDQRAAQEVVEMFPQCTEEISRVEMQKCLLEGSWSQALVWARLGGGLEEELSIKILSKFTTSSSSFVGRVEEVTAMTTSLSTHVQLIQGLIGIRTKLNQKDLDSAANLLLSIISLVPCKFRFDLIWSVCFAQPPKGVPQLDMDGSLILLRIVNTMQIYRKRNKDLILLMPKLIEQSNKKRRLL
jgi:hypothetical protein